MALPNEDLQAIATLFDTKLDTKLKPINERLDKLENKVDTLAYKHDITYRKLDDLSLDVKYAEREIRRDIKHLKDDTETLVVVLEGKGFFQKAQ